jgi:hypothetical protein
MRPVKFPKGIPTAQKNIHLGKPELPCTICQWPTPLAAWRPGLRQAWYLDSPHGCQRCRWVTLSESPFSAIDIICFTGKTTCLDVLAQRKNIGVISGDILVDGRPLTADFARGTAYGGYHSRDWMDYKIDFYQTAEQMDVHEGLL